MEHLLRSVLLAYSFMEMVVRVNNTPDLFVGKLISGSYAGKYLASIKYYWGFSGDHKLWDSWSAEQRHAEIVYNMEMGKLLTTDINNADFFNTDDPWMKIIADYDIGEVEWLGVKLSVSSVV